MRLIHPQPVDDRTMLWVAAAALILNAGIMLALNRRSHGDLNLRAAFIHMLGDAVGAGAIILGALAIRYTGWLYIDPLLSFALGILIAYTAWTSSGSCSIFFSRDCRRPRVARRHRCDERGRGRAGRARSAHLWSLGSNTHALSSHVLIDDMSHSESEAILRRINEVLCTFGIRHSTIQFEHIPCVLSDSPCRMVPDPTHVHDHGR